MCKAFKVISQHEVSQGRSFRNNLFYYNRIRKYEQGGGGRGERNIFCSPQRKWE
jgi:hypothetical protein